MNRVKGLAVAAGLFCLVLTSGAVASDRMVLVEMYTNTSCTYCPPAETALDGIADNYPDTVVAIRYHTWWPGASDPYYTYNTSENRTRTNYYGVAQQGVPAVRVDGFIDANYSALWNIVSNRYHMEAPIELNLSGTYNQTSNTGTLNVEIVATDLAYFEELYLRCAITESDLYYSAPNGVTWHHQTMRDMVPNATGTSVEIEYGETVNVSLPFSAPAPLNVDNLELVVWLQTDFFQTLEVYQAARIKPSELVRVSVDDEPVSLPESFTLSQNYPNPFNATTNISYSLENQTSVDLAVYDLSGRKVAQLVNSVQGAGEHRVVWNALDNDGDAVATGIYFYRLKTDTENTTKRMVLLK